MSASQCANFLFLENSTLRIGVDPSRGAGIGWLSKPGGKDGNLLNEYDCGRFVQQSYYGRDDGSTWNGNPWRWNPVQCGSWQNKPARVLRCESPDASRIATEVNPRNWGGQELLEDVVMRADISMGGNHAHIWHQMTYTGAAEHPVRIQELPAVFVNRKLSQLVFYEGSEPWKGKPLTTKTPNFPNENYRVAENWAAWVDPSTGQGVGVYVPVASTLTCYRVGPDNSKARSDCSYFAPTMRFAVKRGVRLSYHAFITLGTVDQIRKEFSGVRSWALNNNPQLLQGEGMQGATPAI